MMNYKFPKFLLLLIFFSVLISCGGDSNNIDDSISAIGDTLDQGNSDDSNTDEAVIDVDFKDLVVETSWITEDTSDRKQFDAADVDDKEWMDIAESGKVFLTCLAGDSHRTELKEDSGDEEPLTVYKKMEYKANLYNIPENGVTIAQIHNRAGVNRPWIRVYIDKDSYIKIKETETTPDEDKSTYSTYPTSSGVKYTAGDDLNIIIEIEKGSAYFYVKGGEVSYEETLTPSSDWDDYSSGYYLKAGVYTEGDDVEPKIEFNYFSIEY